MEGTNLVRISQTGGNLIATCTYGSVSWRMEGTVSRDGVVTGRLVHTAGVSSSATGYAQDRTLTLSADRQTLEGRATFAGGAGGHPLTWKRVAGGSKDNVSQKPANLTGAWVHSADPSAQTPANKVIIVQDGTQITLTQTYKSEGTQGYWVTLACTGPLSNREVRLRCDWAPGGNPLGFAGPFQITMRLSDDGDHLDGTLQNRSGSQESHYSRVR